MHVYEFDVKKFEKKLFGNFEVYKIMNIISEKDDSIIQKAMLLYHTRADSRENF